VVGSSRRLALDRDGAGIDGVGGGDFERLLRLANDLVKPGHRKRAAVLIRSASTWPGPTEGSWIHITHQQQGPPSGGRALQQGGHQRTSPSRSHHHQQIALQRAVGIALEGQKGAAGLGNSASRWMVLASSPVVFAHSGLRPAGRGQAGNSEPLGPQDAQDGVCSRWFFVPTPGRRVSTSTLLESGLPPPLPFWARASELAGAQGVCSTRGMAMAASMLPQGGSTEVQGLEGFGDAGGSSRCRMRQQDGRVSPAASSGPTSFLGEFQIQGRSEFNPGSIGTERAPLSSTAPSTGPLGREAVLAAQLEQAQRWAGRSGHSPLAFQALGVIDAGGPCSADSMAVGSRPSLCGDRISGAEADAADVARQRRVLAIHLHGRRSSLGLKIAHAWRLPTPWLFAVRTDDFRAPSDRPRAWLIRWPRNRADARHLS